MRMHMYIAALLAGAGMPQAQAQDYPVKPIRIITAEAGGGSDLVARVIAQALSTRLGKQAIVDNRGLNGAEIVAHAQPDGYTLLSYGTSVWLSPLMRKTAWDPVADFAPITLTVVSPNVVVVNPSLAVNSVKELIAYAKAKPGELNYASGGSGATSHLAAELFKSVAGVNIMCISYKGNGPAVNDLIGGQVQLMFATAASASPHLKSGRLRAIAVTSEKPTRLFPDLPTVAATLPGYESTPKWGMFAPAKTPPALIARLNLEIRRVLERDDVKEKFFNLGSETAGSTPEQFGAAIKSEMARIAKLVKDAGIREE